MVDLSNLKMGTGFSSYRNNGKILKNKTLTIAQ
jgi:hypothetical protein